VQIAVLNDTAAEDLGDQDALEAELERELAAADEEAEEAAAGGEAQRKKKVGAAPCGWVLRLAHCRAACATK
jgi:hypothetical protein